MLHPSAVGNFIRKISVEPTRPPLGPIRVLVGEFGRSARRYHVKKMRVNSFASRKFLSWLCRPTQPLISAVATAQVSREHQKIFFFFFLKKNDWDAIQNGLPVFFFILIKGNGTSQIELQCLSGWGF